VAQQAKAVGAFEALGEPVRRRILELLADGERPVGPLVVALRSLTPISQPAVSQHLKVLLDAGLVTVRAAGTRRLYALDTTGLDAARAWLDRLADPLAQLAPFAQPLDALATEVARGRRANKGATPSNARTPSTPNTSSMANTANTASTSSRANTPRTSDRPEEPPDAQDRRPA
jgi:DNA-binding transcriptional ArsR family regulator